MSKKTIQFELDFVPSQKQVRQAMEVLGLIFKHRKRKPRAKKHRFGHLIIPPGTRVVCWDLAMQAMFDE